MINEDYPTLYQAASSASANAQDMVLGLTKASSIFLICGTLASLFSNIDSSFAILSSVCFLLSLGCYAYNQHGKFSATWYRARALAESIKTSSWRLMMKAEPYANEDGQINVQQFTTVLQELLEQNQVLGPSLSGNWGHDQITPEMQKILRQPFEVKKRRYLSERIEDQCNWYTEKSISNSKSAKHSLIYLIIAYLTAITLSIIRILTPTLTYLPIDVFAVAASCIIGWTQLKRFDELASAYSLTAQEVGIIKSRYHAVSNDGELSKFVVDAENAFSREHTQWAARRDH